MASLEALPSLLVVTSLLAILAMRGKRVAIVGTVFGVIDVVWCGVSLFVKQLLFVADARIESHPSAMWGTVLGAVALALMPVVIPSRRWRVWVSWGLAVFGSLALLVDSVYGRWFGDLFPTVALLAAGHLGSVTDGAWNLVKGRDAWLVVDLILAVPLMIAVSRIPEGQPADRRARSTLAMAGVIVLIIAGWQVTTTLRADSSILEQRFSNRALVEHTGPLVYHALDGWLVFKRTVAKELLTDEGFNDVRAWFAERKATRAGVGPLFGIATGMNLVVIQVESLQGPMVTLRINGREVMPNLAKLRSESIYFSQVFDQTDEGRTSDAEWLDLTSQLPEPQGAAAFIDAGNHLVGFPSLLAGKGYQTLSAVAFAPSFWNRRVTHPAFGFARNLFAADFGPGEAIGWGLNDRDFLLQTMPRLTDMPTPFAAWLITQSLHYPFDSFPDSHKTLDIGAWNNTSFGNYIHGMHYFDQALAAFLSALDESGLRAHTVVVITGDHSAGFPWSPEIAHAFGFPNEMLHWTLAEQVPFVISVPGAQPAQVSIPVGQVDIAPTLLNLLGVDSSRLPFIGRNVLGTPGDEPIVRRDGSWVDSQHLFLMRGQTTGTHCYARASMSDVPLSECDAGSALADRQTDISRRVREFDLQRRLLDADSGTVRP